MSTRENSEIEELKQLNQRISNAMSSVAQISSFQKEILSKTNLETIYQIALEKTLRIVSFDYTSMFLFNKEEFTFDLTSQLPESCDQVNEDFEYFQENGSIGWCLNNDRILSTSHEEKGKDYLLSALSTDSKIKGLFIGQLKLPVAEISQIELQLLEIVLANTAMAIDNRELQLDLKVMNEELEDKVEERTETLQKALKAAHAASQAKSDFLAVMSHEIRTPLNGVLGMADHLIETQLSTDQKHFTETIIESGKGLLNIINDILDFSKIEAGKLELDKRAFCLKTTIENVCEIMAKKASEKELKLLHSFDLNVPSILIGDDHRLKQVFLNLVSNALKFTHEGHILIKTRMMSLREDEIVLQFAVEDTGIGIPDEKQEKLFKSFTQVDSSTSRQYGGTGLGLAISKEIVEMMGGQISIKSKEGKGTTFYFTLPLKLEASQKQVYREQYPIREEAPYVYRVFKDMVVDETLEYYLQRSQINSSEINLQLDLSYLQPLSLILCDDYNLKLYENELRELKQKGHKVHVFKDLKELNTDLAKDVCNFESFFPLKLDDVFKSLLQQDANLPISNTIEQMKFNGEKVLLVDDDKTNQMVASLRLEKMNLDVDIADGGHTAVELFQSKTYQIVFMDCQMPDMDGYETTEIIRDYEKKHSNVQTPIIALTANATKRDRDRCFAVGMNDYLSKPLKTEDIKTVLQQYLSDQQKRDEALLRTSMNFAIATESDKEEVLSVDLTVIRELLDGVDLETEKSLLEIFITDCDERVELLNAAFMKEDYEEIKKLAHAMKGGAANIGVFPFMEICGRLETGKIEGDLGQKIFSKLIKELNKVKDFFEQNYGSID